MSLLIDKRVFHLPGSDYADLIAPNCTANFSHIKVLFFIEHVPLKVAHALKKLSPNPNVARTSPSHALSMKLCVSLLNFCDLFASAFFHYSGIFSESTINGLRYYSETPECEQTASFLELILKTWKIVNVKSLSKGEC